MTDEMAMAIMWMFLINGQKKEDRQFYTLALAILWVLILIQKANQAVRIDEC